MVPLLRLVFLLLNHLDIIMYYNYNIIVSAMLLRLRFCSDSAYQEMTIYFSILYVAVKILTFVKKYWPVYVRYSRYTKMCFMFYSGLRKDTTECKLENNKSNP